MARILKPVTALLLLCLVASFCESKHFYRSKRNNGVDKNACLQKINEIRAAHGGEPLTWDSFLEDHALAWAKQLASSKQMRHDPQEGVSDMEGENLYRSGSGSATCAEALDKWYGELKLYKAKGACASPPIHAPPGTEDFTQLVWKSVDTVGVAVVGDVVVARFFPPGNFEEEYEYDVEC